MRLDQLKWISHSSGFESCKIGDYKIWKHLDGKTFDIYHRAGLEVWDKLDLHSDPSNPSRCAAERNVMECRAATSLIPA
jgi:hypothetical protein